MHYTRSLASRTGSQVRAALLIDEKSHVCPLGSAGTGRSWVCRPFTVQGTEGHVDWLGQDSGTSPEATLLPINLMGPPHVPPTPCLEPLKDEKSPSLPAKVGLSAGREYVFSLCPGVKLGDLNWPPGPSCLRRKEQEEADSLHPCSICTHCPLQRLQGGGGGLLWLLLGSDSPSLLTGHSQ